MKIQGNPASGSGRNSYLSRRNFLAGGAALGALAGLSACASPLDTKSPAQTGAGKKLNLTMFAFLGGDLAKMPKEFAKEYMAAHKNVNISFYEQTNAVGYGKMLAQRKTDPTKPLINLGFFNVYTAVRGIGDSMWEKLDYSSMKNVGDILPTFQRDDRFGIGIGSDQFGLAVNKEKLGGSPDSWASLWDPAYRGKLAIFAFPWYAVFMAAKLNGGGLDNMEPGWKLWEENAKQIKLVVDENAVLQNALSAGTAPMCPYFAGTTQQWINGGAPLEYIVPKEGAIPLPVVLESVADQGDDEQEVCQDIINEMLAPDWVSRWAETAIQIPANAKSKLPKNLEGLPAFQKSTVDNLIEVDYNIIGENLAAWTERWNSDIVSKI
jgi:putative spermidine/putrescine transport system substrate-binding protein